MSGNLGPWVEYVPDVVQDDPEPQSRKGRRLLSPESGDPFFVYGEYDDGNGMWIITGVSRDLSPG